MPFGLYEFLSLPFATKYPLQPVYSGPYKVVKCTEKHFTVVINNIPINWLKLAHLENINDNSLETNKQTQPRTSKSSCHIRWPKKIIFLPDIIETLFLEIVVQLSCLKVGTVVP